MRGHDDTRRLREATGAEFVYVYVFGDPIRHLHVHLAPHSPGDPLNTEILVQEAPAPPQSDLTTVAEHVRSRLASDDAEPGGLRA